MTAMDGWLVVGHEEMKFEDRGVLTFWRGMAWAAAAVACFHLAYEVDALRGLMLGFLYCLVPLARLGTNRKAFYLGLGIGFAIYAPQLLFFWSIFQGGAIALWGVLAFWVGLFILLSRQALLQFGRKGLALLPVLWLGLEFLRSELYYLQFSWLNPGFAFSGSRLAQALGILGVYGIGAVLFSIAATAWAMAPIHRAALVSVAMVGLSLFGLAPPAAIPPSPEPSRSQVDVAGVQLEFPTEDEVLVALNQLTGWQTNVSVFALSEYTFKGPIPDSIKAWCRDRRKFLIVGAEEPVGDNYHNTAFVIGPEGRVVFQQAKSVPIQFFNDGLPAREQQLWNSPWGKVGLAVCYDLSYRRVIDRLVAQGAQALIIPTMDVIDWGERQHRLHGRVAPMRAAEYGVPIFRLCSSGISQAVEGGGRVTAIAPFAKEGAVLGATMVLGQPGRRPLDHWLGPGAVGLTTLLVAVFLLQRKGRRGKELNRSQHSKPRDALTVSDPATP
jgi:apolipoprotein N-acyltransferase